MFSNDNDDRFPSSITRLTNSITGNWMHYNNQNVAENGS
jgi:hypothetical protein